MYIIMERSMECSILDSTVVLCAMGIAMGGPAL